MSIIFNRLDQVALKELDPEDALTDFSLGPMPDILKASIAEIGVLHPIVLTQSGDRLRIVCGHRRVTACEALNHSKIPALVSDSELNEETMLMLNLTENRSHRSFSDVEKGRILNRLTGRAVPEDIIIGKYMPLMGMERSKKLYQDLTRIDGLNPTLQQLLHELNVPQRIFHLLTQWDASSRDAAEHVFTLLRPGINKWRDLLELLDETSAILNKPPGELLQRMEIQSILGQNDLQAHEKYDRIVEVITPWRYPVLSDLKINIAKALDKLPLGPRTRVRIQESFETEEIKIEIKSRDQKSLVEEVERLKQAAGSEAMGDLMRILRQLK